MSKMISYWGKGGVGKSTCAAATALRLAEEGKTLLLSSDPTPSLSELLEEKLRPKPIKVCDNLWAAEISEEEVISMWKLRFGEEVYRVISSIIPVDRYIIDYIAGAPGISDEFILYYIYTLWNEGDYDFIVWDTAAAGGGLRLLRIERELYSHLGDAARLYLKLKGFFEKLKRSKEGKDPLELINEWRTLAEKVLSMMTSDNHYVYIVTIPEKLGIFVTKKIIEEFNLMNINPNGLLINMVERRESCPNCKPWVLRSIRHEKVVKELLEELKGKYEVHIIPLLEWEPKGRRNLLKFARLMEIENMIKLS